ncbi:hypothetical protein GCM10027059_20910 [Myceligenerans halotolerans]
MVRLGRGCGGRLAFPGPRRGLFELSDDDRGRVPEAPERLPVAGFGDTGRGVADWGDAVLGGADLREVPDFRTAGLREVPDFGTADLRGVPDFGTAGLRDAPDSETAVLSRAPAPGAGDLPEAPAPDAFLREVPDFGVVDFGPGVLARAIFPEVGRPFEDAVAPESPCPPLAAVAPEDPCPPRAAVVPEASSSPRAAVVPESSDGSGRAAGRRRPGPDGDAGRRDEGTPRLCRPQPR